MEIVCPRCGNQLMSDSLQNKAVCPGCGSVLSVAEESDGFILVMAEDGLPDNDRIPVTDDVTEDYLRWQAASVFCIIAGIVIGIMIGMLIFRDYRLGGFLYAVKPGNLLFIEIAGALSVCLVGIGWVCHRYLTKHKKNYMIHPQNRFKKGETNEM